MLPSEEELSRLLVRVRGFADDVAGYERLLAGELSRQGTDLELARRAALRLLATPSGRGRRLLWGVGRATQGGIEDGGSGFPEESG